MDDQTHIKSNKAMNDMDLTAEITSYWDDHIHDLEITTHPIGTIGFFQELEYYRYDKLRYLPGLVNFNSFQNLSVLEVGCGVGTDLVRFAKAGAVVTGIDLSQTAIELARQNFAHHGCRAELLIMNGEALEFSDNSFNAVYAHGVLQYTADARQMVSELHRVLKPGGQAIMMVYNRYSWLNLMKKITKVSLEHEDAPVLRKYSIAEFKRLLEPFSHYRIIPERFPVKTKLHKGWKARLFNDVFVGTFNVLPRALVRPLGWHLMAFAKK